MVRTRDLYSKSVDLVIMILLSCVFQRNTQRAGQGRKGPMPVKYIDLCSSSSSSSSSSIIIG